MIESALRWATLGVLAILPIAGPTDMVWAHATLAGVLMLLAATGMISGRLNPDFTPPLFQLLAGFAFLCFLQMIPLPQEVLRFVSPLASRWGDSREWGVATIDTGATQLLLVKLLGAASAVLLLQSSLFSGELKFRVLQVIAFSAGIQAVIGGFSLLSGEQWGPYLQQKVYDLSYATGTFVYHNHFAAFLNLGACACILLLSDHRVSNSNDPGSALRTMSYRLLLVVIVIGLTLSRSRGGALSFMVMMGGNLLFEVVNSARRPESTSRSLAPVFILLFSVVLVDVLVVSQWFGLDALAERFAGTSLQSEVRDDVSGELLDDILPTRAGLLGVGGGAFEAAFIVLKNRVYLGHWNFAHNDFLEVALTFGFLGIVAVLVFLKRQFFSKNHEVFPYRPMLILCFTGIHSSVDFAFAAYANFLCLVVLLSVTIRLMRNERSVSA